MKHDLVTLVVIMILKDTATFQVLFIVSLFCAWNITTVEINSGFHYLKVKSAKCLCFCRWSWSCYVGLGLKNLVLFTSLVMLAVVRSVQHALAHCTAVCSSCNVIFVHKLIHDCIVTDSATVSQMRDGHVLGQEPRHCIFYIHS